MKRTTKLRQSDFAKLHALLILHGDGAMIVGKLTEALGALPAQTSRLLRSFEKRGKPFIKCTRNDRDRRKIDVELLSAGEDELRRQLPKLLSFASTVLFHSATALHERLDDETRNMLLKAIKLFAASDPDFHAALLKELAKAG